MPLRIGEFKKAKLERPAGRHGKPGLTKDKVIVKRVQFKMSRCIKENVPLVKDKNKRRMHYEQRRIFSLDGLAVA